MSLYCDLHTIFVSPNDSKLSIEDQLKGKTVNLTQFGRAMEELGITIIKANSPQAKGRIEKLWDRLPVEFKITMEAANAFLSQFIVTYNEKFGVEPAFRPLEPDHILCIKDH